MTMTELEGLSWPYSNEQAAQAITSMVEGWFWYDPQAYVSANHPLNWGYLSSRVCADNAQFLTGLLRSIGIDASTQWLYGGVTSGSLLQAHSFVPGDVFTIQVDQPAWKEGCPPNPIFRYHVITSAGGSVYDPSYGAYAAPSIYCYAQHPPANLDLRPKRYNDSVYVTGGCQR